VRVPVVVARVRCGNAGPGARIGSNTPRGEPFMDIGWIIIIVLVVLLIAALGPRAGFYGGGGAVWDILALIILIALVVFLLRAFGVLAF
jgi:hypothetical protein